MKLAGKTINNRLDFVLIWECEKCGLRTSTYERECPRCKVLERGKKRWKD